MAILKQTAKQLSLSGINCLHWDLLLKIGLQANSGMAFPVIFQPQGKANDQHYVEKTGDKRAPQPLSLRRIQSLLQLMPAETPVESTQDQKKRKAGTNAILSQRGFTGVALS